LQYFGRFIEKCCISFVLHTLNYYNISLEQLFRRVASALPGMENTPEQNKDLIDVKLEDTPQDHNNQEGGGCGC